MSTSLLCTGRTRTHMHITVPDTARCLSLSLSRCLSLSLLDSPRRYPFSGTSTATLSTALAAHSGPSIYTRHHPATHCRIPPPTPISQRAIVIHCHRGNKTGNGQVLLLAPLLLFLNQPLDSRTLLAEHPPLFFFFFRTLVHLTARRHRKTQSWTARNSDNDQAYHSTRPWHRNLRWRCWCLSPHTRSSIS